MEELTVRRVDEDERDAKIECYECERPAEFVEEQVAQAGPLVNFMVRRYFCAAHKPGER